MKKRLAVILIVLAFVGGVAFGHFLSPYISVVGQSYEQVSEAITIVSVKENMKTIEKAINRFARENGHYPKNSSVSWLKEEVGMDFENPITYKIGEGKAYMSGRANKPGIVGYESDSLGLHCRITGYGAEDAIELTLADKKTKETLPKEEIKKSASGAIEDPGESKDAESWNVLGANTKITEKSDNTWKFFWEFTVYNHEKAPISLAATVEFLNTEGSIIADEHLRNLNVPEEASKTFNGYTLINADIADRITEINIKAKREKFVQK
jgi:hypothetical protein